MPTAPAQRCANVATENKWTYDENRVLLGAIEQFSNGKIVWDVVGKVMKDAGFERTGKMCRHRYGRIVKGQTKPGVNRCNCGQRRKGHTCTGAPVTPERALALLRAGADLHAAAEPGGPTPLSLAQEVAAAGRAAEGTRRSSSSRRRSRGAARRTPLPGPARERAVELLRVGQCSSASRTTSRSGSRCSRCS